MPDNTTPRWMQAPEAPQPAWMTAPPALPGQQLTPEDLQALGQRFREQSGVMLDPTAPENAGRFLPGTGPGQFARSAFQGLTFGWGDEIVGGLGGDAEFERNRLAQHRATDPAGAAGAEFLGGLGTAVLPAGIAARGASTGAQIGLGALSAGAAGALYGAGAAEPGQRLEGALRAAGPTAAVGAAIPLVASGIARALLPAGRIADDVVPPVNMRGVTYTADEALPAGVPAVRSSDGPQPPAIRRDDADATQQPLLPTRDELQAESRAAFGRAEATGFTVSPQPFQDFANQLAQRLDGQISGRIHPNSIGALEGIRELIESGQPLTLQRLLNLRELLGDAASSADVGDRRIGTIIKNAFDDFFEALTPEQVAMANWWDVDGALAAIQEGRTLWGRFRKVETIETMQELAEDAVGANYTQAGFETAIRQQFRGLLRTLRKDPRQRARWTDEEFAMMEAIARGEGGWQTALRRLGGLAPRGALTTGLGIFAASTGNVPLMAATAAGEVARRASTGITNRNVGALDAMVRTGGGQQLPAALQAPVNSLPLFLLQQMNAFGMPRLLEGAPTRPTP